MKEELDLKIRKMIARQFNVAQEKIIDQTSINDDLGADSLDKVELLMKLEDEFKISISDEIADRWTTVKQVIMYLEEKI